jgi:hypothetical protein
MSGRNLGWCQRVFDIPLMRGLVFQKPPVPRNARAEGSTKDRVDEPISSGGSSSLSLAEESDKPSLELLLGKLIGPGSMRC